MVTINKDNIDKYKEKLTTKVIATLSNGLQFAGYRATLCAIIKRGYYKGEIDKIDYAEIDSILYLE